MDLSRLAQAPAIIAVRREFQRPVTDEMLSEITRLLQNIQLFIEYGMPDQATVALKERFAGWIDKKYVTCQFAGLFISSLMRSDSLNEDDPLTLCLRAQFDPGTLLDQLLARVKEIGGKFRLRLPADPP